MFVSSRSRVSTFRISNILLGAVLLGLAFFAYVEVSEEPAGAIGVLESLFILVCILVVCIYWATSRFNLNKLHRLNSHLSTQVETSNRELTKWQQESSDLLRNLSIKIGDQLSCWHLTNAEKDVALGLLKGLSHKEIATIRNSSEKTVRLQAASLYKKASVEGRAQLAAFFLDGLSLVPKNNEESES